MKRLGTDFWPDRSCRAFCMSAPIGPMVSNSTAVKSILFCLKTVFIFVQNGHVVLENTITLLSLMSWATAALGSSPFTTGGMVVVERLQLVVEIKLCLKLKIKTVKSVSERWQQRIWGNFICFPKEAKYKEVNKPIVCFYLIEIGKAWQVGKNNFSNSSLAPKLERCFQFLKKSKINSK